MEVLRLRIEALERLFEQPTSDENETDLRETLLTYASVLCVCWTLIPSSKLKNIGEQLASLGGKSVPLRYIENVQDGGDVNGLLEDLQEAVGDYMVCW